MRQIRAASILVTLLLVAVVVKLLPQGRLEYAGSDSCKGCHGLAYSAWSESQHTKMMRPVGASGVLVADFEQETTGRQFELSDAVWAIGGKWEQQFMGHDGETETLLPGVWLKGKDKWDFKGWDGWEVPVPVRRCHGCHTVGLDVATGKFVEPNIGCESCHGPGGWHVRTLGFGRIHSSSDAEVCGQCHARGRSVAEEGKYYFPTGYRPGDELAHYFKEAQAVEGQTDKEWWANGFERSRHQEITSWRQGGHANSLASLRDGYDGRYGAVTKECLACHAGDYILAGRRKPGLEDVKDGITCSVCHQTHGDLDKARMDCADCHGSGAFYHQPQRNAEHVACGASSGVGCVGCHMPKVIQIGGVFALHTHRPGVVPPTDTEPDGMPNSCQNGGCHSDRPIEWLREAFDRSYLQATPARVASSSRVGD